MLRTLWLLFAQTVTIALALWFVVATLRPGWLPGAAEPAPQVAAPVAPVPPPAVPTASAAGPTGSYSLAAKRAAPAVVSIVASKASRPRVQSDDPWFRQFFGNGRNAPQQQMGLGSGVIVSADG